MNKTKTTEKTDAPKGFRRLKWDERVSSGDFVADERGGLILWEGPSGFRADSFENPIYRQAGAPAGKGKK